MKKIFLLVAFAVFALAGKAQFEQGTKYAGASVSDIGLSYSSSEKLRFGVHATVGYFLFDQIMLKGNVGYDHKPHYDDITVGVGARYYFSENGIFLGPGVEYCHETKNYNDIRIPIELGYCFYINHYVSLEPSVYYNMSLNDFSDKSAVGFRFGFGLYF